MRTISTDQLRQMKSENAKFTLLNVLPEQQFEQKRIPDSENAPIESEDFEKRVDEIVPDKKTPVIVYCSSKSCDASPKAARRLDEQGYENVLHYEGGLEAWESAGESFVGSETVQK